MSTTATPRPTSNLSPTAAILRTEARLFSRELGALFWIVMFPTALLSILGAVPSFREPDAVGSQRVVDLYVPVSVLLSMIMAAVMAMPPVLNSYRERGILRRLRTTPTHPGSLLLAQVALHAAAVVASAVLVIAVGRVVFDVPLPGSLIGYVVAFVLALAASFSVGALVTAVSPNTRVGQTIGTIRLLPEHVHRRGLGARAEPDRRVARRGRADSSGRGVRSAQRRPARPLPRSRRSGVGGGVDGAPRATGCPLLPLGVKYSWA